MSRSGTTSCVTHGATANARHLWLCGLSGPRLRARDRGVSLAFPPLSLGSHLANGSRTNLNSANRLSATQVRTNLKRHISPPPAEITPCGMRLSPPSLCPIASATPSALINSPTII